MIDRMRDFSVGVLDGAKMIWFASIGAVVMAEEAGQKVLDDMVRKGREVEDGLELPQVAALTGTLSDAVKRTTETFEKWNDEVDARVSSVITRVGIPSRNEIAELTDRVEALSHTIEKIRPKAVTRPVKTAKG